MLSREPGPSPRVDVVILNWNGWRDTLQCLESAVRLDYSNFRIVVVDNGSEDGSVQRLSDWVAAAPGREDCVSIVPARENLGFSGGCNLGIDHALERGTDYVFLLNNDAEVRPDTLRQLVRVSQDGNAAITGARVLDGEGGVGFSGRRWPGLLFGFGAAARLVPGKPYWPSAYASGCAIMIRRDLLDARLADCGHVLDPLFFMYCEEVDFCRYAIARGCACLVARDAVVIHRSASSTGARRGYYYLTRNSIILADRWLSLGWRSLFHLYFLPSRLAVILMRLGRRQAELSTAIAAGLIHGYRGHGGMWSAHGRAHAKYGKIEGGRREGD